MRARAAGLVFCSIVVVGGLGCGQPNTVTRERYDLIIENSSRKLDVEKTLGKNYEAVPGNRWEYDEEDRHLVVKIDFNDDGVVINKQWIDGMSGEWDGQDKVFKEGADQPEHSSYDGTSTGTMRDPG